METLDYQGIVEQWKVDLIEARARRMGFRRDEICDLQQDMILDVAGFEYDAARSNGAMMRTALQALIDNHLKKVCRSAARYRARMERLGEEPIREMGFVDRDLAVDVCAAVASLPEREQEVCRALSEGYSKNEIAGLLKCGWHTVDRLIKRIRAHFKELGLDAYLTE